MSCSEILYIYEPLPATSVIYALLPCNIIRNSLQQGIYETK